MADALAHRATHPGHAVGVKTATGLMLAERFLTGDAGSAVAPGLRAMLRSALPCRTVSRREPPGEDRCGPWRSWSAASCGSSDAARPARRHVRDLAGHPRRPGRARGGRDRHAGAGGGAAESARLRPAPPRPVRRLRQPARAAAISDEPVHDAPHRRRPREPPGRHHRADPGRDGALGPRGDSPRRRLRALAQLRARPRAPPDHRLGPRDRELLARHHAPAPLRHAPRVDAAQRAARGLSAARRDRALPARRGARVGLGGLHGGARAHRAARGHARLPRARHAGAVHAGRACSR